MAVAYNDHIAGMILDRRRRLLIIGRISGQGEQGIKIFSFISMYVVLEVPLQLSIGPQPSLRPKSSLAGTTRMVLVCPFPPRQPCTQTTMSPSRRMPRSMACLIPHLSRPSTSSCQSSSLKSGLFLGNMKGYTPRYRCEYYIALAGASIEGGLPTREAVALRVTMIIGHTGRYFEIIRAELPLFKSQRDRSSL